MRRRADFLAARRGERRGGPFFTIEVLDRGRDDASLAAAPPRLGLTVTKKIGNAPTRNRIRRRLREAVRTTIARDMRPGHDYVVVAKPDAATAPHAELVEALRLRVAEPMRPERAGKRTGGKGGSRRPRRSGKSAGKGAGPPGGDPAAKAADAAGQADTTARGHAPRADG